MAVPSDQDNDATPPWPAPVGPALDSDDALVTLSCVSFVPASMRHQEECTSSRSVARPGGLTSAPRPTVTRI